MPNSCAMMMMMMCIKTRHASRFATKLQHVAFGQNIYRRIVDHRNHTISHRPEHFEIRPPLVHLTNIVQNFVTMRPPHCVSVEMQVHRLSDSNATLVNRQIVSSMQCPYREFVICPIVDICHNRHNPLFAIY
jgi:hypothetical protein